MTGAAVKKVSTLIFDFQKKGLLVRRTDRNERFGKMHFLSCTEVNTVSRGTPDSFVENRSKWEKNAVALERNNGEHHQQDCTS